MARNPSIASHPSLDQWIELVADGRILIHTGKVDIGQRKIVMAKYNGNS